MKDNYVKNHNFNYDKEEINKVKLRDMKDVKIYVEDILKGAFVAKVKHNIIKFEDETKIKVRIKKIS